jgi:restriction system protein
MAWVYHDVVDGDITKVVPGLPGLGSYGLHNCIYCGTKLTQLPSVLAPFSERPASLDVLYCAVCGWWHLDKVVEGTEHERHYSAYGQLKVLDVNDISAPVQEVRNYLTAKYDARFLVNPIVLEKTVASVFGTLGYVARVTNPSGDWGIDIYLDGPNDSLIGVQVKRWKSAINVEQLTALTGALVINRCTKGVFVTTSRFRPGAVEAARRSSGQGFPIELVDAKRFYEMLQIAQAKIVVRVDDPHMPWYLIDPQTDTGTG